LRLSVETQLGIIMQRIHQSTSSATASDSSELMTLHHSGYVHTRASVNRILDRFRATDRS